MRKGVQSTQTWQMKPKDVDQFGRLMSPYGACCLAQLHESSSPFTLKCMQLNMVHPVCSWPTPQSNSAKN